MSHCWAFSNLCEREWPYEGNSNKNFEWRFRAVGTNLVEHVNCSFLLYFEQIPRSSQLQKSRTGHILWKVFFLKRRIIWCYWLQYVLKLSASMKDINLPFGDMNSAFTRYWTENGKFNIFKKARTVTQFDWSGSKTCSTSYGWYTVVRGSHSSCPVEMTSLWHNWSFIFQISE